MTTAGTGVGTIVTECPTATGSALPARRARLSMSARRTDASACVTGSTFRVPLSVLPSSRAAAPSAGWRPRELKPGRGGLGGRRGLLGRRSLEGRVRGRDVVQRRRVPHDRRRGRSGPGARGLGHSGLDRTLRQWKPAASRTEPEGAETARTARNGRRGLLTSVFAGAAARTGGFDSILSTPYAVPAAAVTATAAAVALTAAPPSEQRLERRGDRADVERVQRAAEALALRLLDRVRLLEPLRERAPGAEDQRLDRRLGDLELLGDLAIGEALPLAEQDRAALLLGHRRERVLDPDQLVALAARAGNDLLDAPRSRSGSRSGRGATTSGGARGRRSRRS